MSAIDEAFATLGQNLESYLDLPARLEGSFGDERVVLSAEEIAITTPIELSIAVAEDGTVAIGCAPPLYAIETTVVPVFHTIRFTAVADETSREVSGG
jgi:hypothetical protein